MPEPNDPLSRLPDIIRSSDRPIIIYQGAPQSLEDARTSNALGVLFWLAIMTACLIVAGACAWSVWSPSHNQSQFSPIYAEGRPVGLMGQIEERRRVIAWAKGLSEYRDAVQASNGAERATGVTHPLIADRSGIELYDGGVEALRRQWDEMCATIRARIYDRRIALIDARLADLRRQRVRQTDAAARRRIDADLERSREQRRAELERRRTDADPALRCTPAAQAPACSPSNEQEWCNPQLGRPEEFTDGER